MKKNVSEDDNRKDGRDHSSIACPLIVSKALNKKAQENFVKNKEGIIVEFSVKLYQIADKLKNEISTRNAHPHE